MPRVRDQAICLRLIDWSETSQIVALLTREHGVLRGVAKGCKRLSPSSVQKFSGGFELLTSGEVLANVKPGTGLATLTEWDLQQTYRHLRTDLHAQRVALLAADLTHGLLAEHDAHPIVFDALEAFLESLRPVEPSEDAEPASPIEQARARLWALLRFHTLLLTEAGYRPELTLDAATGAPLPHEGALVFDPHAGGVCLWEDASPNTTDPTRGPWRVRRTTLALLRRALPESDIPGPGAADTPGLERANRLLCVYTRAILDRELPSMATLLGPLE